MYVVVAFLDLSLNASAIGPFRSQARAEEVCRRLDEATAWMSDHHSSDNPVNTATQVVELEDLASILTAVEP